MFWYETAPWRKLDRHSFRTLDAEEMLYEFDGPGIFTLRDADGELNLACWSDEDSRNTQYLVVPASTGIIDALKLGRLSVHDALNQPRCWLVQVTNDGVIDSVYSGAYDVIPADCRPTEGTMLWSSLEPILTLRASGAGIVPGMVPGSVIRTCVEGVHKTFKFLSEHVLGQTPQAGRPDEFLRKLFDLPTQRIAFASFEISFRVPLVEHDLFSANGLKSPESETIEKVGSLLNKGLNWLMSEAGEEGLFPPEHPEEGNVLLRALKELTPSSQGSIEQLELRGRILGERAAPLVLNRIHRQRVNTAIRKRSLEPQLIDLEGRVRELDKDHLSFELREINRADAQTQRFVFDEELLEDVLQALQDNRRIRVSGRVYPGGNISYVLGLSPAQDQSDLGTTG